MPKYKSRKIAIEVMALTGSGIISTTCNLTIGGIAGASLAYVFGKAAGIDAAACSSLADSGYWTGMGMTAIVTAYKNLFSHMDRA